MGPSTDLEISLHRHEDEAYRVRFRLGQPVSDADIRQRQGEPASVYLDLDTLQSLAYDPVAFGKQLTEFFFADFDLNCAFELEVAGTPQ